ncbi:hypothetical protein GGR56DRAFT_606826 [Xylariaceae sp. FL0804]|nr:hypothetical protein GGR56DRAFT_606826 [Xylariaceae sp. FL0804]
MISSRPENDPLRAFRGRWIGIDLVTIRESRRGSRWAPHVRFHGLRNEDEVKYLHACLSKRRFRKEYHAPLEICYFLQDIIPCASRTTRLRRATSSLFTFYRVESARSSEGSLPAGQAAQRIAPKAQFEEPTIASLCGSLISIGSGPARRTVTVGGLVMLGDESFALTAGHTDRPEESEESVQAMHMEVREKDYDADVEPPLIFTTEPRGDNLHSPNPGELTNSQRLLEALDSAPIELSGVDWSLIRVHMPTRRLPNIVPVPRHIKQTSGADAYTYLINAAARPKPGPVYVYGGVSGLKQLTMVHGKNHLRLPSGRWLQAWKAHYKSGSCLHKGDSGAWVFDAHCGDVLGQVVATTDDCIYILPLVDIFRNIRGATGLEPRLPTPFEMLGEMGKVYHLQGNGRLAEQYAREALRAVVLAHSNAGSPGRFLADFLNTFPMRRESVCQVIMRTGPDIVATLPSALTDAQYGLMGDIDGALGILRDLRSYAKDYGLDVSRGDECAGDDDDGAEPASRLGNLYGLLCMGRRHPGRLHRHDEKPERIARLL